MRHITPPAIRSPFARYSYGVEIPAGYRILVCSGQLGVAPDDHIPERSRSRRISASATSARCSKRRASPSPTLVRINSFVVVREHLKGYMAFATSDITDPPPASTLMIVAGFSRPDSCGSRGDCRGAGRVGESSPTAAKKMCKSVSSPTTNRCSSALSRLVQPLQAMLAGLALERRAEATRQPAMRAVQFLLNGEPRAEADVPPTMTVLDCLRTRRG